MNSVDRTFENDSLSDLENDCSLGNEKDTVDIPPWERYVLTITEAANFYHIGETKLRTLVMEHPNAEFAVLNGNRVLIKRKRFEAFLDLVTAI